MITEQRIEEIIESLIQEEQLGTTYGDTVYENEAVVYGYNEALIDAKHRLIKELQVQGEIEKFTLLDESESYQTDHTVLSKKPKHGAGQGQSAEQGEIKSDTPIGPSVDQIICGMSDFSNTDLTAPHDAPIKHPTPPKLTEEEIRGILDEKCEARVLYPYPLFYVPKNEITKAIISKLKTK